MNNETKEMKQQNCKGGCGKQPMECSDCFHQICLECNQCDNCSAKQMYTLRIRYQLVRAEPIMNRTI
jgi:hypothetical protein